MSFVHLHVHTEYSFLDGCSRVKDLAAKAKSLGMEAVAITDHGNMFGAVEFYKACKKEGIKPIIGCEVYQAVRTVRDKEAEDRKSGHLVLLCRNETGYHNLIKLVSEAYEEEAFYYKPRTDKEHLRKYSEGLICLSGCMAGLIQRFLLEGRYEEAKAEALELQGIFGRGHFFLELQDHGTEDDAKLLPQMKRLGEETGIPFAATNDSHYTEPSDAKAQEVLLCINTKSTIDEAHKFAFPSQEFYFKSENEMRTLFAGFPGAIENTGIIAEMCDFDFEFGHYHIPSFPIPDGFSDTESYFRHLCMEGFRRRYPNADAELKKRLEYEIDTIVSMGYIEYFLIVSDYITYAKDHGISVGPGRGSAAGSVAAYSLGITDIEPIRYNLIFERFLNPERVSMPDIDTDFCILRRGEVIDYVAEKYGQDHVCQIATIDRQKAKAAVKNVARVYNMPFAKANALTKMMPKDPKATLRQAMEMPDFKASYDADPEIRRVVDMALQLEGLAANVSTHAAGVVVASEPVNTFVPLVRTEKGVATQYTMVEDEELGLLKYDFLGLRNLTAITECLRLIKEGRGIDIHFDAESPMDDPKVYEMISSGDTTGVFQLESRGITGFMKDLKPNCFEDIVAGIALYRPGPMDSIPQYIRNKQDPTAIDYLTPQLEPILSVTYGCIIYQEQVMQIVRDLAGYSFGRSDLVRRAMSKKKHDVMMQEREYFIEGKVDENGNVEIPGCVRNGIPREAAEAIFDEMTSFASYAFNKSHAAAYAVITYRTAWLKCHYPAEFLAALMSTESSNHEHLALYLKCARNTLRPGTNEKIRVLLPSVMESKANFSVTENGDIRFGLNAVSGVGEKAALAIEAMDKSGIDGLQECLSRIPVEYLNSKAVEGLIKAGAFLDFSNIATALRDYEPILKTIRKESQNRDQISMNDLLEGFNHMVYSGGAPLEEISEDERNAYEKEILGAYISGHPLDKYADTIEQCANILSTEIESEDNEGSFAIAAGMITGINQVMTKKGQIMAFLTLEDPVGEFEAVVFPKQFDTAREHLQVGKIVVISGDIEDGKVLSKQVLSIHEADMILNHQRVLWLQCLDPASFAVMTNLIMKLPSGDDVIKLYYKVTEQVYTSSEYALNDDFIRDLTKRFGKENVIVRSVLRSGPARGEDA